MTPKYSEIEVELSSQDGNAFSIIGNVSKAMRRAGINSSEVDAYRAEAISGDYDNLLRVTMATVKVT